MSSATQISELLELQRQPVAIRFQQSRPDAVPRIDKSEAAGCAYWKLAAQGKSFYTEATDHFGCPIGAHTHGIELPDETAKELESVVGVMVELKYIAMEEVPGIPQVDGPFGVAIYAPLADATFQPDVVIVCGNAKQMMLLAEAAHSAGLSSDTSMVGRPTCAAIPTVMKSGRTATNLGCIGNRVYNDLSDDDLYFVIAGPQFDVVVKHLITIINANDVLKSYHQERISC